MIGHVTPPHGPPIALVTAFTGGLKRLFTVRTRKYV